MRKGVGFCARRGRAQGAILRKLATYTKFYPDIWL